MKSRLYQSNLSYLLEDRANTTITLFLNVELTGGLQQYVKASDEEDGVDRRL